MNRLNDLRQRANQAKSEFAKEVAHNVAKEASANGPPVILIIALVAIAAIVVVALFKL